MFVLTISTIFGYIIYKLVLFIRSQKRQKDSFVNSTQLIVTNINTSNLEIKPEINEEIFETDHVQETVDDYQKNEDFIRKAKFFKAQDKKTFSICRLVYFIPLLIASVLLSNSPQSPSVVGVGSCSKYYPLLLSLYAAFVICTNLASS